jgi:hypothetical protein
VAEYERTLRWLEPFGGWRGFTTDTGLCNRIFHWEVAYEINKQNIAALTSYLEVINANYE